MAIGLAETRLYSSYRLDYENHSIEYANINTILVRQNLGIDNIRSLPTLVAAMVDKMLKDNELKLYLDSASNMKAMCKYLLLFEFDSQI